MRNKFLDFELREIAILLWQDCTDEVAAFIFRRTLSDIAARKADCYAMRGFKLLMYWC